MKKLIAWALLMTSGSAFAASPAPYDFQGARLGMTIQEWRALPLNMSSEPLDMVGYEREGEPQAWCEGDPKPKAKVKELPRPTKYQGEAELGVVACQYVVPVSVASIRMWKGMPMRVGKGSVSDVTYKFMDGKLYQIDVRGPGLFSAAPDGLESRWGKATGGTSEDYVNGFGAVSRESKWNWKSGSNSIELIYPAGRRQAPILIYQDDAQAERVEAWRDAANPTVSM
jgi:hypothetical protein